MVKKVLIIVAMLVVLCGAPLGNIITLAQETGSSSKSTNYTLTVIEDEAVPLSDGNTEEKTEFYIIYAGMVAAALVAFFIIGKKAEEKKASSAREQTVARMYMDNLIQEK